VRVIGRRAVDGGVNDIVVGNGTPTEMLPLTPALNSVFAAKVRFIFWTFANGHVVRVRWFFSSGE
jgi:hypothetical protein